MTGGLCKTERRTPTRREGVDFPNTLDRDGAPLYNQTGLAKVPTVIIKNRIRKSETGATPVLPHGSGVFL